MQILLIEDDEAIAAHIAAGLREVGHIVEVQHDGREGMVRATCETYDLIVLDRMLPSLDGLKVLAALRATGDTTPVLILSALGDVDERIKGLRAGGDDYMAKPFATSELLARVEVLGRRGPMLAETSDKLTVGNLVIDLGAHVVSRGGKRIDLTLRELRIVAYLARNAGRVVTRSMLLENVWDYNFDPQTNIIDQHISKVRQKLSAGEADPLIHTVRGVGYVMRSE
ncbi:response regulator transcription factor [Croceicoccus naphthovorans]|uniref:XRE family transcriptional regulator n=1 Tax=Croceicoccus naphthovorans TaxID=1348774 RepID=A0A0G3XBI5_9SPHN|nr:response regulator transcription factor [Croceicoccus naphthovorans]AKM08915.1 XRE family transcriptional regulator [Croceicoccus naphthovorans]MBB3989308.1 two-component system OmpR family response regulator [Croceicoccus naphthovorans]